jgi:hypothetical protein
MKTGLVTGYYSNCWHVAINFIEKRTMHSTGVYDLGVNDVYSLGVCSRGLCSMAMHSDGAH